MRTDSHDLEARVLSLLKPHAGAFPISGIAQRLGVTGEPARAALRRALRKLAANGTLTKYEAHDHSIGRRSSFYEKVFKRERDAEAVPA